MKFYKVSKKYIYFVYLMLFFVCGIVYNSQEDLALLDKILLFVNSLAMIFMLFWIHAQKVIISDQGISSALVMFNKIIKTQVAMNWSDIWKVSKSSDKGYYVVPKKEGQVSAQYKVREMINIFPLYKDYQEILQTLISRAQKAQIDEDLLKKMQKTKAGRD